MATGKTATKHTQVLIDGYDMSGDSNNISALKTEYEAFDTTGYSHTWQNFMLNRAMIGVEGYKAWFNVTSAGVLNYGLNAPSARVICVALGIRGTVALGDPCFAGRFQQDRYLAKPELAGAVAVEAEFSNGDAAGSLAVTSAWGVVLAPLGTVSATATGIGVDNGAASTAGGAAYLHVTAAGGTYAITIEDSANNSTWATIGTFTANGTAIAGEQLALSGTIRRYVRVVATKTSGNLTYFVSIVRY